MYTSTDHGNGMFTVNCNKKRDWCIANADVVPGFDIVEVTQYSDDLLGVSCCVRLVMSCYNTDHDDANRDITVTYVTPDQL